MDPGWPASLARRNRSSAFPKPKDLNAAGVKRRTSKVQPRRDVDTVIRKQHQSQKQTWEQLYKDVVTAGGPAPRRQPLFASTSSLASTPAMRAKLCPALDTTKDWTRVQRKLLPKYLFVLDAVTAVHLLQCFVRLQPPAATAAYELNGPTASHADTGNPTASELLTPTEVAMPDTQQQQQQQQQQHQHSPSHQQLPQRPHEEEAFRHGPGLDQLTQLHTSIYGALAGPQPGLWPGPPHTADQLAAAQAAAKARGWDSAASERVAFDMMLAAVYSVLAPKLAQWPFQVLVKVMCCAGQLHLRHPGFLQAWFMVTSGQLSQQPGPELFSCLEALSRLSAQPPKQWWLQWQQAMLQQLPQLSLTQAAALQLHILHLGLQPATDGWWQQLHAEVLQKVTGSQPLALSGQETGGHGAADEFASSSGSGAAAGGQQPTPVALAPPAAAAATAAAGGSPSRPLTMAQSDTLCTLLCTSHLMSVSSHRVLVSAGLQLCLQACKHGDVSTSAALQLLSACCYGAGTQHPAAAATRAAALELLQQRMEKVSSPSGVAVLFDCLKSAAETGPDRMLLPTGFANALSARLMEVMPGLPTSILLQVPSVLATAGWQVRDERLLASYALATQARLTELCPLQLRRLLTDCAFVEWAMPSLWLSAVSEHIADSCQHS